MYEYITECKYCRIYWESCSIEPYLVQLESCRAVSCCSSSVRNQVKCKYYKYIWKNVSKVITNS